MLKPLCKPVAALLLSSFVAFSASAEPLSLTGSGTWGAAAPASLFSAPNSTWSFAFQLPDPFTGTTVGTGFQTTQINSFSYLLNGVAIADVPLSITFYPDGVGGLFDINFVGIDLSFFGDQVFDFTTQTLSTGAFAANTALDGSTPVYGSGSISVAPVNVTVPEPGTLATVGLALAALGATSARARRRAARLSPP